MIDARKQPWSFEDKVNRSIRWMRRAEQDTGLILKSNVKIEAIGKIADGFFIRLRLKNLCFLLATNIFRDQRRDKIVIDFCYEID